MTPQNGTPRFDVDAWRRDVDDHLDKAHSRIDVLALEMRRDFVSKDMLSLSLARVEIITDNLEKVTARYEKAMDWFMRLILAGFIGALARIVYVNAR